MSIEAWVTEADGTTYLAGLDRSRASPFRRFAISTEINAPGFGSLEYHLDNELVAEHDDLFAYGNLVWFRYRGRTRAWIVEQRKVVLDEQEHQTDWIKVQGRGVLQLVGDRTIWPTHYSDETPDASQWGLGGWSTKTDATALLNQRVVPVVSTTSGLGATVGDPVEIVGGGHRQVGIIESIVAGVSVTLVDNLAYTFPVGSRVRSAASQWRRFVNRAAGEMLWDIVSDSNPRFVADGGPAIARGTIETTGADGWTQDFRFDNALDVFDSVTDLYGDVEMDGLTLSYRNAIGTDRTGAGVAPAVIFEEGADVLRLDVEDNDRDSLSWVVAEGTGHAVFSYLAPKKKLTRSQRKTAARKRAAYIAKHRKAPPAPVRKAIIVKADYAIDLASEAVVVNRRREAFLDAKDVSDPVQLDALADAALDEHQVDEAVGLEVAETRYQYDVDYGLGDWVSIIAPSRGFSEDVRIVAGAIAEDDDEVVRVAIEVNKSRPPGPVERELAKGMDTRRSLGVQNRQPMGNLTIIPINDNVYFDTTTDSITGFWIPDIVLRTVECRLAIDFDQYPMPVSAAASGGGATSGASSSSTSGDSGNHVHAMFGYVGDGGAGTKRTYSNAGGGGNSFFEGPAGPLPTGGTPDHQHSIVHTHSTPNHTHSLTAAATKETYPANHSVTLRVYELTDTTWTLRGTIGGLTADVEEVDLLPYVIGPGRWRIDLMSDAAQPNGGRIGAHLSGYLKGSIQAE